MWDAVIECIGLRAVRVKLGAASLCDSPGPVLAQHTIVYGDGGAGVVAGRVCIQINNHFRHSGSPSCLLNGKNREGPGEPPTGNFDEEDQQRGREREGDFPILSPLLLQIRL